MFDINKLYMARIGAFSTKLRMSACRIITFLLLSGCVLTVTAEPVILLNVTIKAPLSTDSQSGFIDEIASEALRRIGYQLRTVRLPAERALKSSNRGIIDGELVRVEGIDKLYPNLIRVPEKIMDWEFVVFSYKPISLAKGWDALAGKSIAHINGWKILEKNIPTNAEVTKTSNALSLFKLLKRNRTDYVLYERWGGQYLLIEQAMDGVMLRHPPLAVKEMFIYLNNKHRLLVPKLAAALLAMKQDGSYQKLVNKHLRPLE